MKSCPNINIVFQCLWSLYGAKNTIADGLAVAEVGCNAFASCDHLIDEVVSISEDWVRIETKQVSPHLSTGRDINIVKKYNIQLSN